MSSPGIFSVSAFAKLSRTTRDILHHYDKIGLLSPISRGNNNYRYYSSDQLALANLMRITLDMGMPLAEIKRLKDQRTPERVDDLLTSQLGLIDAKMREMSEARAMVSSLKKIIRSGLNVDEQAISVHSLPEEPIILGNTNDYSRGGDSYDALRLFYRDIGHRYPEMGFYYPVWGVYSENRVRHGDWTYPERYYCCHPEGPDRRPAAQYAVGYARGGYGETDGLYRRIIEYIDDNGYEIRGDAYEEYPLNEICITDETNYLIRVMIAVGEKPGKQPSQSRRPARDESDDPERSGCRVCR